MEPQSVYVMSDGCRSCRSYQPPWNEFDQDREKDRAIDRQRQYHAYMTQHNNSEPGQKPCFGDTNRSFLEPGTYYLCSTCKTHFASSKGGGKCQCCNVDGKTFNPMAFFDQSSLLQKPEAHEFCKGIVLGETVEVREAYPEKEEEKELVEEEEEEDDALPDAVRAYASKNKKGINEIWWTGSMSKVCFNIISDTYVFKFGTKNSSTRVYAELGVDGKEVKTDCCESKYSPTLNVLEKTACGIMFVSVKVLDEEYLVALRVGRRYVVKVVK